MDDGIPTDHGGLEVLSEAECLRLLDQEEIGRVAFMIAGEPLVLPVNFRYHQGKVVFRTAAGAKLDSAARESPVAFEIDGWDSSAQKGWSVVVQGVAEHVTDRGTVADLERLGLRPWAEAIDRSRWIRIRPYEITGRRIV